MISHGKDIKIFTGNANPKLAADICKIIGTKLGESEVKSYTDLTHAVKQRRAREAQRIADEMQLMYLDAQIGKTLSVLLETAGDGAWQGHSENYCEVRVPDAGENWHGVMKNVKILAREGKKLSGIVV